MRAWSHLPNAKYIDHVLAEFHDHCYEWAEAWQTFEDNQDRMVARDLAIRELGQIKNLYLIFQQAKNVWYKSQIKNNRWSFELSTDKQIAWDAGVRDSLMVLVLWERAGKYLEMGSEKVKMLACLGDPVALLIYPAAVVLNLDN